MSVDRKLKIRRNLYCYAHHNSLKHHYTQADANIYAHYCIYRYNIYTYIYTVYTLRTDMQIYTYIYREYACIQYYTDYVIIRCIYNRKLADCTLNLFFLVVAGLMSRFLDRALDKF